MADARPGTTRISSALRVGRGACIDPRSAHDRDGSEANPPPRRSRLSTSSGPTQWCLSSSRTGMRTRRARVRHAAGSSSSGCRRGNGCRPTPGRSRPARSASPRWCSRADRTAAAGCPLPHARDSGQWIVHCIGVSASLAATCCDPSARCRRPCSSTPGGAKTPHSSRSWGASPRQVHDRNPTNTDRGGHDGSVSSKPGCSSMADLTEGCVAR